MNTADSGRYRYEVLAERLAERIRAGGLPPGERLPSVRALSRKERVSISTALHAYELLERRGLVRSRPQSGYYVDYDTAAYFPPPEVSRPPLRPAYVDVGETIIDLLAIARSGEYAPFAAAVPADELLPVRRLNKIMADLCRRADNPGLRYELPPGNAELRRQLGRLSFDRGEKLGADDFIITTGCMEALNLALRAVARPGAVIAIESPAYYGILLTIASLGMKALEIPTHPSEGVRLEELEKILKRRRIDACLFSPNFNNPLGSLLSEDSKEYLARILQKYDTPLIEDDIYGDLHFDEERPRTVKSFDRKGQVLLCASFSKTLVPGYRVGYIAPGHRWQRDVEKLKFMNTVATNSPGQVVLAEYLRGGSYERHLRKLRRSFREQVATALALIRESFPEGTRISPPRGGFVLWIELPEGSDSHLLYNTALAHDIAILPGLAFSGTGSVPALHPFKLRSSME